MGSDSRAMNGSRARSAAEVSKLPEMTHKDSERKTLIFVEDAGFLHDSMQMEWPTPQVRDLMHDPTRGGLASKRRAPFARRRISGRLSRPLKSCAEGASGEPAVSER